MMELKSGCLNEIGIGGTWTIPHLWLKLCNPEALLSHNLSFFIYEME